MFKKQISLFLAFFLLVSNMGWAFNVHYCGNEIASVTLQADVESSDKAIGCCGLKKAASKCCKDKVVHFEKKSDNATIKSGIETSKVTLIPPFKSRPKFNSCCFK